MRSRAVRPGVLFAAGAGLQVEESAYDVQELTRLLHMQPVAGLLQGDDFRVWESCTDLGMVQGKHVARLLPAQKQSAPLVASFTRYLGKAQ